MSKARLVITAVRLEKRPVAEVVATYGVSRAWLYKLLARYDAEGDAAFEPRSKRPRSSPTATPRSSPTATPRSVVDRVLALRNAYRIGLRNGTLGMVEAVDAVDGCPPPTSRPVT